MTLTKSACKSAPLLEEINGLIVEYLEINGLEKTVATFSSECKSRSIPGPFPSKDEIKAAFTHYDGENLLTAFDEGRLDRFNELWKAFQSHVLVTSDDMKKLEVYLRVHFALWPCAQGEPEYLQQAAMGKLKAFFEEQSTQLSHDAAILPLFALPYVSDPKNHPIFKDLFQPSWSQRLRTQLEATLSKYYDLLQQNLGTHCRLAGLVLNSSKPEESDQATTASSPSPEPPKGNDAANTTYHRDQFYQLVATYRQTRKLLKNTRESYGKLLKVASELIIGLEASVSGQKIALEPIMKRCYDIFPDLFTPADATSEDNKGEPDKEYFKKLASSAQFDNIIDSDVSLFFIGISDLSPDNLDYVKMKQVLKSDDSQTAEKLCLLQALRWLLTKSTPKCRETALESFIQADILGVNSTDGEYRTKLFDCMMTKNPTYLKECFARLLNTLASMKAGRAYMGSNSYAVDSLVKSLHTFRGLNESYICQMVIAALQKLSLRKQMRLVMIEQNVIHWLVTYLNNEYARQDSVTSSIDSMDADISKYSNPYLMEYAWALLMNLCLHEESKPFTSTIANDIVSCVTQMLVSKPSKEVYPYVISTLYSLLRNPDIFATAKKMAVQNLFANCTNVEDTEMCHHFNHVAAILATDGFEKLSATTGEVEYDDDDDIDPTDFEPEIEVSEAWEESLKDSYHTGDDLLLRKYLKVSEPMEPLPTPQIRQTKRGTSKRPTGSVFVRPTTPSKSHINSARSQAKSLKENESPRLKHGGFDGDHKRPHAGDDQGDPRLKTSDRKKQFGHANDNQKLRHAGNDIIEELSVLKNLKSGSIGAPKETEVGDFKISSSPRRDFTKISKSKPSPSKRATVAQD